MRIVLILLTFGLTQICFSQIPESTEIEFFNCQIKGNVIDNYEPKKTRFTINYDSTERDTLKVELIHLEISGKDSVVHSRTIFSLTRSYTYTPTIKAKPNDNLLFVIKRKGNLEKRFFEINSTTSSLTRPYFIDVYFIYNQDTLTADKFQLKINLKQTRNVDNFRFFFDDPATLPNTITVEYPKGTISFPLAEWVNTSKIFHGKLVLQYVDKKRLRKKDYTNKNLDLIDLDTSNSQGHGTMTW